MSNNLQLQRKVGVALVHYPVLARDQSIVTTSITNLDIHDIARSAFTFGVSSYFLVHPVQAQRDLAMRVRDHWTSGSGAGRIPDRNPPMQQVKITSTLDEALAEFSDPESGTTESWVTSAQPISGAISHRAGHELLCEPGPPVMLVFGTGWGLAPSVVQAASRSLLPIDSPRVDGYNHLSVRAAVAILLDRLMVGGV